MCQNKISRPIKITIIALFIAFCTLSPIKAYAQTPTLTAECAILAELSSGRVLYSHNANAKRYPASTTKIMTALVILENCNINDTVTIPKQAQGVEGSSIYLASGEKLTVLELLYGLMLRSGNDAATALAIHCAGSVYDFAQLMNQKAKSIGCQNTNFVNPSGLPSSDHYTTAYDLMLISRQAMMNDTFRKIVSTQKINISWDSHEYNRILINENKMLYTYDGANGIKTGYTKAAGRCLVSSAEKNGMTLIAVVLNCSPMYAECAKMLDYGFENYTLTEITAADSIKGNIPVKNGFKDTVPYQNEESFTYPLSESDSISVKSKLFGNSINAPVVTNTHVGYVEITLNGEVIKNIPLVTTRGTQKNTFFERLKTLFSVFTRHQLLQ